MKKVFPDRTVVKACLVDLNWLDIDCNGKSMVFQDAS